MNKLWRILEAMARDSPKSSGASQDVSDETSTLTDSKADLKPSDVIFYIEHAFEGFAPENKVLSLNPESQKWKSIEGFQEYDDDKLRIKNSYQANALEIIRFLECYNNLRKTMYSYKREDKFRLLISGESLTTLRPKVSQIKSESGLENFVRALKWLCTVDQMKTKTSPA
ncbi:hypothetical protein DPSP01_013455 [Paraphaeosphaeria sporulosa]